MPSMKNNTERLKLMKRMMILGYTAIILFVTILVSVLAMSKTDSALKTKVSSMTSALNVQLKLNIDSYLRRMETTGTLIFTAEEVYLYDATDPNNDAYEALATEKVISDKLFDLCIMENFVDFGIVYRNNHTVGKVSNGTIELFGDKIFTDLSGFINRPRTNDGWSTGYNGNNKRIYYTKKINENAILVISFYTTELEDILEHTNGLKDVTIRLTDSSNSIIFSSVDGEIGGTLPSEILSRTEGKNVTAEMDDEYLITMNSCGDCWKVICSVPTEIILKEKNEVQLFIIIVGIIASICAVILSIFLSVRISDPVNNIVTDLDQKATTDMLTGVLNKRSFEEQAEAAIADSDESKIRALILLDVDNFKGVNDTLGHAYGDKVLENIGEILRSVFRSGDLIGRIGGDEFSICIKMDGKTRDECTAIIEMKCRELCGAFHSNYTGDNGDYKISASIGVAFSPYNGLGFNKVYRCADSALYKAKKTGKDTYTIYTEELQ